MTMTLAHPPAEDLGRFVEGTLDDAGRTTIIAHIADCDECRILVVDAAEFEEESVPAKHGAGTPWWWTIAAAVAILLGTTLFVNTRRDSLEAILKPPSEWIVRTYYFVLRPFVVSKVTEDPLGPAKEAASKLSSRSVEARLDGFSYVRRNNMRGGQGESDLDLAELQLEAETFKVLEEKGNEPRTLHAKGVAELLKPKAVLLERKAAVTYLQLATEREPDNASYASDFAGGLIAIGDTPSLQHAITVCDSALRIDRAYAPALFNRAKAFELLGQSDEAISAYKRYLSVDPSSPWATEAHERISFLKAPS